MRILIPVLGFGRGGGYRVLSELASAWTRAGHEVTMLVHREAGTPYFPTNARIIWSDVRGRLADAAPPERPPRPGCAPSLPAPSMRALAHRPTTMT